MIGLALLVYAAGIPVPLMEPDAATYAVIPMEMVNSGDWLDITLKGEDWLDKPHFQFWMTAAFYALVGVNLLGYKLPAILFVLLGAYYTFRFGKDFYSRQHGLIAAMVLLTAEHIIISNQDVRAEPYLTGLTIFSLYYVAVYLRDKHWWQLMLTGLGLACLMMTKGLFTIIPVGSAVGLSLIYSRRWREIVHWQWLMLAAWTLLFLTPTLYGYYQQFDLHPEKVVNGQTGVSGLRFFFWDSQWGRFANTGPIKSGTSSDPFFFFHTLLWAFLPWAFLAYFALYDKTRRLLKRDGGVETYSFFGFVFLFLIFAFSKFQLPHYLNPLFPLLAILVADVSFRYSRNRRFLKIFHGIQAGQAVLLVVAVVLLHYFFLGGWPTLDFLAVAALVGLCLAGLYSRPGQLFRKVLFVAPLVAMMVNYYLNRNFYPVLLPYQAETALVSYLEEHPIPAEKLLFLNRNGYVVDLYFKKSTSRLFTDDEPLPAGALSGRFVFTDQEGVERLQGDGLPFDEVKTFPHFRITMLDGEFINRKTREQALQTFYLLKIPSL